MEICGIGKYLFGTTSAATHSNEYPLKDRVCCNWDMAPSLIVLVVCVVGVCACLVWESYYMMIPFAVGFIADLYPIYQAYQWHQLQSFAESNDVYEKLNGELKQKVVTLEEANKDYKSQNDVFAANNATLAKSITKLKRERKTLAGQIKEFAKVTASLSDVEEMAKENHEKYSESLVELKEQVSLFSAKNGELDCGLNKFVRILERIEEWKNAEQETNRRISQLQQLSKAMAETQADAHAKLEESNRKLLKTNLQIESKLEEEERMIETIRGVTYKLEAEEKRLTEVRAAIAKAVDALITATADLSNSTTDLHSVKEAFTKINKELEETTKKISKVVII